MDDGRAIDPDPANTAGLPNNQSRSLGDHGVNGLRSQDVGQTMVGASDGFPVDSSRSEADISEGCCQAGNVPSTDARPKVVNLPVRRITKAYRGSSQAFRKVNRFKKFTLFPNLPAELRIKIWRYALPRPRLVPIPVTISSWNREWDAIKKMCKDNHRVAKFAIELPLVCKEAFEVLRMRYKKFEGSNHWYGRYHLSADLPTLSFYVNVDTDTILVNMGATQNLDTQDRILKRLEGVEKLVVCNYSQDTVTTPSRFKQIRNMCPWLTNYTIGITDTHFNEMEHKYRFPNVPTLEGEASLLSKVRGDLAGKLETAEKAMTDFRELKLEDSLHGVISNFDVKVAMAARKVSSTVWALSFGVHENHENHAHWEPVVLSNESFRLYSTADPPVQREDLCKYCHVQRWWQQGDGTQ